MNQDKDNANKKRKTEEDSDTMNKSEDRTRQIIEEEIKKARAELEMKYKKKIRNLKEAQAKPKYLSRKEKKRIRESILEKEEVSSSEEENYRKSANSKRPKKKSKNRASDPDLLAPNNAMKRTFQRVKKELKYKEEMEKIAAMDKWAMQDDKLDDSWQAAVDESLINHYVVNVIMPKDRSEMFTFFGKFGTIDYENSMAHPKYPQAALRMCLLKDERLRQKELEEAIQQLNLLFVPPKVSDIIDAKGHVINNETQLRVKYDLFIGSLDIPVKAEEIRKAFPDGLVQEIDIKEDKNCAVVTCENLDKMKKAMGTGEIRIRGKSFQVSESIFNFPVARNLFKVWSGFWPADATSTVIRKFVAKELDINPVAVTLVYNRESGAFKGYAFLTFESADEAAQAIKTQLFFRGNVVRFSMFTPRDNEGNAPYPDSKDPQSEDNSSSEDDKND